MESRIHFGALVPLPARDHPLLVARRTNFDDAQSVTRRTSASWGETCIQRM